MNGDKSISDEIVKAKIRRALLSGPDSITSKATVAEMDAQGEMTVLRPGRNQWVCPRKRKYHRTSGYVRRSHGNAVATGPHGKEA